VGYDIPTTAIARNLAGRRRASVTRWLDAISTAAAAAAATVQWSVKWRYAAVIENDRDDGEHEEQRDGYSAFHAQGAPNARAGETRAPEVAAGARRAPAPPRCHHTDKRDACHHTNLYIARPATGHIALVCRGSRADISRIPDVNGVDSPKTRA